MLIIESKKICMRIDVENISKWYERFMSFKKLCIGTIVTYSIVKPHYLYMMLCFRHMSWKIRDTQPLWERSYVALPPIAERTCFTMRKDTITTYCYCVYNGRSMIFHINVWALGLNSIRWILVWSLLGAYQSILTRVRSSRKSLGPIINSREMSFPANRNKGESGTQGYYR